MRCGPPGSLNPTAIAVAYEGAGSRPTPAPGEKKRILAAIDAKIAGKEVVASPHAGEEAGAQVIDLTQALMASLKGPAATAKAPTAAKPAPAKAGDNVAEMGAKRKGVRRAAKTVEPAAESARTRVPGSAFAPDKRD